MFEAYETQVVVRVFHQLHNDSHLGRPLKPIVHDEHAHDFPGYINIPILLSEEYYLFSLISCPTALSVFAE